MWRKCFCSCRKFSMWDWLLFVGVVCEGSWIVFFLFCEDVQCSKASILFRIGVVSYFFCFWFWCCFSDLFLISKNIFAGSIADAVQWSFASYVFLFLLVSSRVFSVLILFYAAYILQKLVRYCVLLFFPRLFFSVGRLLKEKCCCFCREFSMWGPSLFVGVVCEESWVNFYILWRFSKALILFRIGFYFCFSDLFLISRNIFAGSIVDVGQWSFSSYVCLFLLVRSDIFSVFAPLCIACIPRKLVR